MLGLASVKVLRVFKVVKDIRDFFFGGCGFFGYYGHFIDLRRLERVRLYASEWRNFVEITDIYEDRLYVSCADADRLVAELTPPGGNRPDEDAEEEA